MLKETISRLLVITFFFSLFPLQTHAQLSTSFNPNKIISNEDFFKTGDMNADEIQSFLSRKGSFLANYSIPDIDGATKRAADIVYRAATDNGLNPRFLLVLLQKEQSLIESSNPSQYNLDWATGYSRCDSCLASDPALSANKGFTQQVQKAAARTRYYLTHPNEFRFHVGEAKLVDGQQVTPENSATVALYNYTPHLHGNFNFWKLWLRYFERIYPDGTLVKATNDSKIWLITDGKKRLFSSMGAFLSRYSLSRVLTVDAPDLEKYAEGPRILFPQYSLLQSKKGAVFLVVDDKKYGIPSRAIFKKIGFHTDEIIKANDAELSSIPTAGLISNPSDNPRGELYQDTKTGGIFYVEHNSKHPILERQVLSINFPYETFKRASQQQLDAWQTGDPIVFKDGTLVSQEGDAGVYVISNGQKRPFISGDVFESLGYQWSQVIKTKGATLARHPLGNTIDLGKYIPDELPAALASSQIK